MFSPNEFIVKIGDVEYGIHTFADGERFLCTRRGERDWITLYTPTQEQMFWFDKHGTRTGEPKRVKRPRG